MNCLRNVLFFSVNLLLYGALTIPVYAQGQIINMIDGELDSVRLIDSNPHLRRPCTPVPHEDSPYGLSCSEVTSPDQSSLISPVCETPPQTDGAKKGESITSVVDVSAQYSSEILKLGTDVSERPFPFKFPTDIKHPTDLLKGNLSPKEMVRAIGENPSMFSSCLTSMRMPSFSLDDVVSMDVARGRGCFPPEPARIQIVFKNGIETEYYIRKHPYIAEAA